MHTRLINNRVGTRSTWLVLRLFLPPIPRGRAQPRPLPSSAAHSCGRALTGWSEIDLPQRGPERFPLEVCVCVCVGVCVCVQLCLTLCDPVGCSLPGSSVHRISQARILKWVIMLSSRGSSRPRDQTCVSYVSCVAGGIFTTESPGKPSTRCPVLNEISLQGPENPTL